MSDESERLALVGRVKMLETALRKVMKRYKHGSTWAKVCEDALKGIPPKPEPMLRDMQVDGGALEMTIEDATGIIQRMAVAMAQMLDGCGAKNYSQSEVSIGAAGYVMILQRRNGKTPHQLRQEAEAERDSFKARVEELERETKDAAELLTVAGLREHVAKAVLAEREACAKSCDMLARDESPAAPNLADDCAEAIRARGGS